MRRLFVDGSCSRRRCRFSLRCDLASTAASCYNEANRYNYLYDAHYPIPPIYSRQYPVTRAFTSSHSEKKLSATGGIGWHGELDLYNPYMPPSPPRRPSS